MDNRIAIVTGANRGIGFEISRQLAKRGLLVVLASRDPAKGRAAVRALCGQGLEVESRSPARAASGHSLRFCQHFHPGRGDGL